MPKCILHIGMHKTGTTSIQLSLAELADENFYYARILGSPGHSLAICSIFASKQRAQELVESRSKGDGTPEQKIAAARRDLKNSINTANGRTLVISGEGLVRLKMAEISRLKDFLVRNGYDDIEVIAYIRPPAAYVTSAWLQRMKMGGSNSAPIEKLAPSYRNKFAKFDSVFGVDKVKLFKFDPARFVKNDVVLDLCQKIGVPDTSIKLIRKNESISKTVAQLIYRYGKDARDQGLPPLHPAFVDNLSKQLHPEGVPKARVSPNVLQPIVDRLKDDIAWMEQRLGESLQEDLGEERETDIRSEAELLEPVSGINEKLIGLLTTAGTAFTEKDATDTNTLLRLLMRRGANQMPNHPRGGKNPMSSIAAEYAAERRGVQAAQPEDESAEDGHSGKSGPLSTVDMPKPKGIPVTRSPRPLVNIHKNLMVLWSPKSACTTAYVWFSHVSGFLPQVRKYAAWPHKHRQEKYERSRLYFESIGGEMADMRSVRIIRDPYGRAVSIYRHALQTRFADKALHDYSKGRRSLEEGMSFLDFLDFTATLDMTVVDIHFRPQFHPYEAVRKPDRIINISKEDLFTGLNAFERDGGMPETDFGQFSWLHDMEGKRKAVPAKIEGEAIDRMAFNREQVAKRGQFPSYDQLLTPEAKIKIEAIYKSDFDAYRDYL